MPKKTQTTNPSLYPKPLTDYELKEEALRLKGESLIGKYVQSKTFVYLAYRNKLAVSPMRLRVLNFHIDTNGKEPLLLLHFRGRREVLLQNIIE